MGSPIIRPDNSTLEFASSGAMQEKDGGTTNAKLANAYINDLTEVDPALDDYAGIADTSDSGNKKKALLSKIVAKAQNANLLINGGFDFFQRQVPATPTALADDTYTGPDRWYGLIQGANATAARVAGTDNTAYALKAVAGGTTNRFGFAQIVESFQSIPMRGQSATFFLRVRPTLNAGSGSMDIRCAVLEWTGTADTVTSEIVNDWTSGTFTTGNFFTSTTLTLVGTAVVSATHNTWTDLSVSGTVSSSCNNLIVFFWHEDVPANAADFLEVSKCGLYAGAVAPTWMPRPPSVELILCQRYFAKSYPADTVPDASGVYGGSAVFIALGTSDLWQTARYPVEMRTTPTILTYSGAGGLGSGYVRTSSSAVNIGGVSVNHITATGFLSPNKAAAFSVGAMYDCQWTASAEL